jgi:hypothetical protein
MRIALIYCEGLQAYFSADGTSIEQSTMSVCLEELWLTERPDGATRSRFLTGDLEHVASSVFQVISDVATAFRHDSAAKAPVGEAVHISPGLELPPLQCLDISRGSLSTGLFNSTWYLD